MYTSVEVCRLVGCSYRQLDYWTRVGYVTPRVPACGSGSRRMFDDGDLERAGELKRASDALRRGLAAV